MAFWTFLYGDGGNINHEIDIELFGKDNVIYSSYTSENDATHVNDNVDYQIYDNVQHVYRFDWYRGEKVEYYIDDVLQTVITTNVPDRPMKVWIGAWCPSWAGEKTNDFSEMIVYSFEYRSFD